MSHHDQMGGYGRILEFCVRRIDSDRKEVESIMRHVERSIVVDRRSGTEFGFFLRQRVAQVRDVGSENIAISAANTAVASHDRVPRSDTVPPRSKKILPRIVQR